MGKNFLEINKIVNEQNTIYGSTELENFSVFGLIPKIIAFPISIEQISEILKFCSKNELSVVPWGNGTKMSYGKKPKKVDVVISLKNLNNILEHSYSDLIATTQCGTRLKNFQTFLRERNQFLPIDPPHTENGATLGGIIAINDSGPSRLKYGTCRELILEVKVVRPDGELIRGGAKVVKNVAGYDLPKLFVGSLGTLGIIVECSFRLFPIPEYSKTYVTGFSDLEDLKKSLSDLLDANLVLTCLEIANSELSTNIFKAAGLRPIHFPYTVFIKVDNMEKAVKDQIQLIEKTLSKKGVEGAVIEKDHKIWDYIRNFPYINPENTLVCKASVRISDISKVLNYIQEISENLDVNIECSARAGNGVIFISIKGENKIIAANLLRSHINSIQGNLIIIKIPNDIEEEINIWGNLGPSIEIMKRIKMSFDPNNILNPGRLL